MSANQVLNTPLASTPRVLAHEATPAVAAPSAWRRLAKKAWHALEVIGHARARQEMLRMAAQFEGTRPELAKQLRQTARQAWH